MNFRDTVSKFQFGEYLVDTEQRLLLKNGEPVRLKPKTFELLIYFLVNPNRVIDKDTLMSEVWPAAIVEESNLSVHISTLRKTLEISNGSAGSNGDVRIETFPKVGYRFSADVRPVDPRSDRQDPISKLKTDETNVATIANASRGEHFSSSGESQRPSVSGSRLRLILAGFGMVAAVVGSTFVIRNWNDGRVNRSLTITRVPGTEQTGPFVISPNGEYLAHGVDSGNKIALMMTHIESGSSVQLLPPEAASFWGMTFSPDSNLLYFGKRDGDKTRLYRIPFLGGPVTKVLDDVPDQVSFSPDGSRFCFIRVLPGNISTILTARVDGSDLREIARREPPRYFPTTDISWSPDGRRIAVAAINGSTNPDIQIVTVDVETGAESPLTGQRWSGSDGLQWLADGSGLVASLHEQPQAKTNVWFVPYPTGEPRQITADLENYGRVSVSSGKEAIAAGQFRENTSLWFVPAGRPDLAQRANVGKHHRFQWVRWLPDGGVVFGSDASLNRDVWRANLDGSGERQLTNGPQSNVMPVPTSDGRYIIFSAFRDDNGLFELWRMDPDGSNQVQLTPSGGGAWQPTVSPDGKWAFYTSGTMDGPPMKRRIWRVPVEGGEPVLFMDRPAYQPDVSPDGRYIACWIKEDDKAKPQAAVFSIDGGELVMTVDGPTGNRLAWTPDGKGLSYIVTVDAVSNVWTQPLDGSPAFRETQFTSETIRNFHWSADRRLLVSRYFKTRDVMLIRNFR